MRFLLFFLFCFKIFATDCDPAQQFFINSSIKAPLFVQEACVPVAGVWVAAEGKMSSDPKLFVVDYFLHPVWVWEHTVWSRARQKRFFKNPDAMLIVTVGSVWRSDGVDWLPKPQRCWHLSKKLQVIYDWKIRLSAQEAAELEHEKSVWCEFQERFGY